jgi:alpha-glucosidase
MEQAAETGVPALRPLFLEFPGDKNVTGTDDEFLFGSDLLVAPVLHEGVIQRDVYLPEGDWYDYWTGKQYTGGQTIQVPVALTSIPMFVRNGGFIFRQPVVQSTDEMPGNALKVLIVPAKTSESVLYEDDGKTLGYRNGDFMKRQFRQTQDEKQTTIEISAPEGSYRPAKRDLILELWMDDKPKKVSFETGEGSLQKMTLSELAADSLTNAPSGWSFTNGLLSVKSQDTFEPMRLMVEHNYIR